MPDDFAPTTERQFTYRKYEIARLNNKALRVVSISLDDGRTGTSLRSIYKPKLLQYWTVVTPAQRVRICNPFSTKISPSIVALLSQRPKESSIHGQSFFISSNGFMGLVPEKAVRRDDICLFFEGATPVVLRRRSNWGGVTFTGPSGSAMFMG